MIGCEIRVTQLEVDQNTSNQNMAVYNELYDDICDGLVALGRLEGLILEYGIR
jgi:hypothetical protein